MNLPSFYTDEFFNKSQKDLYGLGNNILSGDLPDYYKGIGESNSPEFQSVLKGANTDISRAITENAAKRGSRGGRSLIGRAVADNTSKMRYQDLIDSISRKQGLLNTGTNIVSGVGDKALSYGGQQNQFNISKAQLEFQQEQAEAAKKSAKKKMWTDMLSAGIGAVGNIYGVGMLSSVMKSGSGGSGGNSNANSAMMGAYMGGGR